MSAEGAKRGVERPPEVFPPDDLPRPSRPKAGLGLVMMMMRMLMRMRMMMMMMAHDDDSPLLTFVFILEWWGWEVFLNQEFFPWFQFL